LNDAALTHVLVEDPVQPAKLLQLKKGNDSPLILLTPSDKLVAGDSDPNTADHTDQVSFVVAERHPLRCKDDLVDAFAQSVPAGCSLRFHSSLQDPVLRLFVGDSVEKMLRGLGMKETMPSPAQWSPAVCRALSRNSPRQPSVTNQPSRRKRGLGRIARALHSHNQDGERRGVSPTWKKSM